MAEITETKQAVLECVLDWAERYKTGIIQKERFEYWVRNALDDLVETTLQETTMEALPGLEV